jgi:hypothetical protein
MNNFTTSTQPQSPKPFISYWNSIVTFMEEVPCRRGSNRFLEPQTGGILKA